MIIDHQQASCNNYHERKRERQQTEKDNVIFYFLIFVQPMHTLCIHYAYIMHTIHDMYSVPSVPT